MRARNNGFTLIELLVVIGIIGLLAGGVGLALNNRNPDSSVRTAQGMVVSALSVARGQAAINQADVRMVIDADANTPSPTFLRSIRFVVALDASGNNWREVGSEIVLPEGVYIVPNTTSLSGVSLAAPSGTWGNRRLSSMLSTASAGVATAIGKPANSLLMSSAITALGASTGGNLIVAPGRMTGPTTLTLDNPDAIRGLAVSIYGVPTLVNEATSFD